jgi:rubrerythrin
MGMTVEQAIIEAIQAEKTAEEVYLGLEQKFRCEPEVAAYWKQFAVDEFNHAEWIKNLTVHLTASDLEKPVETQTEYLFYKAGLLSSETVLAGIRNLAEAFDTATALENGETNAIFCFLIDNFAVDQHIRDFLLAQLAQHIHRLSRNLPVACRNVAARQSIKALD